MVPAWLALYVALQVTKPVLEIRAFPQMTIATGGSCANVTITAKLKGPEIEGFYCPAVEWTLPDGTRSFEESDCPPYAEREFFPNLWRKRVCLWTNPTGGVWTITVALSRAERTLIKGSVDVTVR